jgi:RNA polymerase sigma-70 factor (ECF subfamily)
MVNTQDSCSDADTDLMRKAAQGDGRAYEELYRRYLGNLLRFLALWEARVQPREDLAQEVFLRVWRNRERYHLSTTFKTYLFACAKNVVREYKSKIRRDNLLMRRISLRALRSCPPESDVVLEIEELVFLLREWLAALSDRQERVIELVCIRGLSSRTAARILHCTAPAIRTTLHRARKNLRQAAALSAREGEGGHQQGARRHMKEVLCVATLGRSGSYETASEEL